MGVDFYGPRLKVERAEHHIDQLKTIFRDYVARNVQRLRPKKNYRSLKKTQPVTLPKHTPTVLGDAIHNLRASLDHAYCIMVEANGGVIKKFTYFPFGGDRQSLEGSINGQKLEVSRNKTPQILPSDIVVQKILDEIQPYPDGRLGLYGLHLLDITDKHHVLIPTVQDMRIERLDFVDPKSGAITGDIRGITIRMDNAQKSSGAEFIKHVASGNAVLHGNPKNTFDIVFAKGKPFEGESILKTLELLKANVVEALNLIEKAETHG